MEQRTKNRLREHTDHIWLIVNQLPRVAALDGQPGTLLKCSCKWFGWLPTEDVH